MSSMGSESKSVKDFSEEDDCFPDTEEPLELKPRKSNTIGVTSKRSIK